MIQAMKDPLTKYHVPSIDAPCALDYKVHPGHSVLLSHNSHKLDHTSHPESLIEFATLRDGLPILPQWQISSPLYPDLDSFEAPFSNLDLMSPSPYERYCSMSMDETNYLSWSYDGADIDTTVFAPSHHNSYPASPSISILSASTDDSVLSPPPSLAEFSNPFGDMELPPSLPNDYFSSSSTPSWLQIPSPQTQQLPCPTASVSSNPSHTTPARTSPSLEAPKSSSSRSRDPSPNQSDSDQKDPKRRYPCLIAGCGRRFTSQYTLKVHMEAHKPKPRVSFPCTLGCSEKFSRQHDRLRHEVAKHGKICEFSCDECGRFFSTRKTLGNHKCPAAQGTRWVNTETMP